MLPLKVKCGPFDVTIECGDPAQIAAGRVGVNWVMILQLVAQIAAAIAAILGGQGGGNIPPTTSGIGVKP
jgi:hypothetical protein